jgi:hypothetical protein
MMDIDLFVDKTQALLELERETEKEETRRVLGTYTYSQYT